MYCNRFYCIVFPQLKLLPWRDFTHANVCVQWTLLQPECYISPVMWMDSLNLADCLQAHLTDFTTLQTGIHRILDSAIYFYNLNSQSHSHLSKYLSSTNEIQLQLEVSDMLDDTEKKSFVKISLAAHTFNTKKQSNIPWQTAYLGHSEQHSEKRGEQWKLCYLCSL